MANKHILSLEIPTVSNCDLLCIKDTSQYSKELAVDCEELLITSVSYTHLRAHETGRNLVCRLLLEKLNRILLCS